MPMFPALVRIGLILPCSLGLLGFDAVPQDLCTLRELSRVAGMFAPSR